VCGGNLAKNRAHDRAKGRICSWQPKKKEGSGLLPQNEKRKAPCPRKKKKKDSPHDVEKGEKEKKKKTIRSQNPPGALLSEGIKLKKGSEEI